MVLPEQAAREAEESERRRRKAAAADAAKNYQTLLAEAVKDPGASWHEWRSRLGRDPQARPQWAHAPGSGWGGMFLRSREGRSRLSPRRCCTQCHPGPCFVAGTPALTKRRCSECDKRLASTARCA